MSCQHVFTKGPQKGDRCPVKPQRGSEYCSKHRSCAHGANKPRAPRPKATTKKVSPAPPVKVGAVSGDLVLVPGDSEVAKVDPVEVEGGGGDPWVDPHADFWDWTEHHHYPEIDKWGSDCVTWTPPVCNY